MRTELKKNNKPAGNVGKSPLKLMPSSISLEHQATGLPQVFVLRNIFPWELRLPHLQKNTLWVCHKQTLAHEIYFQRIMVSQRQGHCVCLWATHLPNTVKPEPWVIQTENIKTLTRTSPKGLLLPRQWIQLPDLRGLSCFCSVPDLSQGERFGTKQMPSMALGRPLGPWTALLSRTALPQARELFTVWMLAMVYDFLVQILVAFHLVFQSVWLPSPSFFSRYTTLLLTPLLQFPSLSHRFFFPPISPCSHISNLKQKLKSKNILN